MTSRLRIPLGFALLIGTLLHGCGKKPPQRETENRMAHQIISLLKLHEAIQPTVVVTNLSQLYSDANRSYPYIWDKWFRQYGRDAGFANSIYEKYVFIIPPTHIPPLKGDLLLLSALSFPDDNSLPSRVLVCKIGLPDEAYGVHTLPELRVQELLNKAGLQIPKAFPMPPPPVEPRKKESFVPWTVRVSEFFDDQARSLGFPGRGGLFKGITVALLVGVFTAVVAFLWFTRHSRS